MNALQQLTIEVPTEILTLEQLNPGAPHRALDFQTETDFNPGWNIGGGQK